MRIACLGWGSLYWDPRELTVQRWHGDGPMLPLEFSRVSSDGRVTLVLDAAAVRVPTMWTLLAADNLPSGISQLAAREGVERLGAIGRWPSHDPYLEQATIAGWAKKQAIDGVVWTAPKPGLQGSRGTRPSLDDILSHIATLDGSVKEKAAEYVQKAPEQVATEWRDAIRRALVLD